MYPSLKPVKGSNQQCFTSIVKTITRIDNDAVYDRSYEYHYSSHI